MKTWFLEVTVFTGVNLPNSLLWSVIFLFVIILKIIISPKFPNFFHVSQNSSAVGRLLALYIAVVIIKHICYIHLDNCNYVVLLH